MNSLPSVDVDIEGNVSLRGNENVRILIDGRPSNLSAEELLETIPAESIEKIEIITNPSAKYDPDGISGILNIIIKQNKKLGFQGSVNAGIGSANNFSGINKYNGAVNLSYKKGKWDILANYSYRENIRESSGDFVRTTITPIGGENILEQTSENERGRTSQTIKTGFGYSFSDKNKILYNANIRLSDGSSTNNLEYLSPMELKNTISETDFNTIRNDITYIHNFDNTSSIEINAYRNDSKNTGASVFATENTLGIQPNEKDSTIGKNSLTTAQADYNIETEDYKLEIGIKGQLRKIDSDYKYLTEDNSGNYIVDNNRSDHYLYDEKIFSTYTNYGKNWDKWSLQAGVRLEHVSTESGLIETDKYKSDNFNFYPSVFVVRKIGENNELGASYSKRVSRPSTRQLNPAKRFTDTLNIRMGNPYLNPEFTNSFELTFNSYWKGGSFNSAIFYRDILDKIQRVKLVDENGVSTTTYDNISNAQELGMEASVMTKLYDWWSINASANIYYSNLETDDPNYNNNGVNWFMKINNSFKMGKTWSLQASGKYTGEKIIPQGHIEPMYNMELGIQKSLFNKKATISFRLSDIFNTYKMTYYTTGSNFEEEGNRKWESRVAYLTFSYNFGDSMKNKKKGQKEGASEMDSEATL